MTFGLTLAANLAAGEFVTATATNSTNNDTSEFSAAILAYSELVVTTTADTVDGTTTNVPTLIANPGADGRISLREAIAATNATAGLNIIRFGIPPAGAKTIVLGSALPGITSPVTIDGTTQPGWTNAAPFAPVIELDATSAGNGLQLYAGASGSTIRGLCINRAAARQRHLHRGVVEQHHRRELPGHEPGRHGPGARQLFRRRTSSATARTTTASGAPPPRTATSSRPISKAS